jgi:hypothetical protein
MVQDRWLLWALHHEKWSDSLALQRQMRGQALTLQPNRRSTDAPIEELYSVTPNRQDNLLNRVGAVLGEGVRSVGVQLLERVTAPESTWEK